MIKIAMGIAGIAVFFAAVVAQITKKVDQEAPTKPGETSLPRR